MKKQHENVNRFVTYVRCVSVCVRECDLNINEIKIMRHSLYYFKRDIKNVLKLKIRNLNQVSRA